MFGLQNLKSRIEITSTTVECPVKGCGQSVARKRKSSKDEDIFQCPDHRIYVSPSTFKYASKEDNLLWKNGDDLNLLENILKVKRESRMEHDNSEDALTWNVFRWLEKANLLGNVLSRIVHAEGVFMDLVYWSYSVKAKDSWQELNKARDEFGETMQRGSEPDLIALTDKSIFFIETKLTASNDVIPSDITNRKKYLTGGNEWHKQVFVSDFESIAIQAKKYELFRFWLLGSWLAKEMHRDFYLVNVVPAERETDIEARFTSHIRTSENRKFKRVSWEEIYHCVNEIVPDSADRQKFADYVQNKTIGYNRLGELQKAFSLK